MAEKSNRRRRPGDEDDDDRPQKRRRYEPDDDDDEDELPRRGKKKVAAGGNGMLLFAILGAGVLLVGIVLMIVFALPRTDNKGANADKAPNRDVKVNPSGGYEFKLAVKESTSFEVTFKKDHLVEVHSFAPVLISVIGAEGRGILNGVDRGGFLAFKNTETCKVHILNNSIGTVEGVIEFKQTPLERMPEPTEKNTIPPKGAFEIPLDVPVYVLSGKGIEIDTGQGKWINTLSPKDASLPIVKQPYKLFQLNLKAGLLYAIEVRSSEFSTSVYKYGPAGRYIGAEGTPLTWRPKEDGAYRFAVTANEKNGEGLFVISILCFK